ncbi:Polyamine transporter 3 [Hyphodiscus hymeniophilus]|uniref:Polyamine transporter 3 n=1 Tax=Hyphodiscus hymeniophilus TaxID=353542 RepID=A0A9P7AX95_9HELO|nr:Polyamine transporter 3 [Hyphodiscus hymeniophilus]
MVLSTKKPYPSQEWEASEEITAPRPIQHRNKLSRTISGLDEDDARNRYEVEAEDNKVSLLDSAASSITAGQKEVIHWEDGDPANPYNWSSKKKAAIVSVGMLVVINSTMGSSLPSNAVPFISKHFNITSSTAEILPISIYLIGYVVGPLFFGPLSESYGRQAIMVSTFLGFTIFTMACALSPTWSSLLVFRFLTGVNASSPISIVGAMYADVYDDPVARGRAVAVFTGGTCIGPLIAPIISGFVAPTSLGWRWSFWIGLIFAGASWPALLWLPETYGPVLLTRRARKLRASTNNPNIFAPLELEKKGFKQMATVTLTRPLRMLVFELIVLATCIYVSVAYAIFYMYFTAYPIIFEGIYKQSPGVAGLMFLPIGAGTVGAIGIFLYYDSILRKAQAANKPWTRKEEFRRIPLACLGGPLYVVALFWLGWTARESIPFWVPMLAGIPFGIGFILIFMALINYLTDAYEIFAASAMAAASCCRSLAGAVLPFGATALYGNLGVAWGTSLLAFLSLAMCVIPFMFLWKGDVLRERSTFCRFLKEKKEKELEELARERLQRARRQGLESGKDIDEKV